jgi:palmitoyltransferase
MAIGILLSWHVFLLFSNQTTIEFYQNQHQRQNAKIRGESFVNIYDLGWRRNFLTFFGCSDFISWLLPTFQNNPGNGMKFEVQYVHQV